MDRWGITVYTFILLAALTVVFAVNPGAKIRVTKKGIDYANTVAGAAVRKALSEYKIGDQSGESGKLSWSVSNIQTDGVFGPNTHIILNPENGGLTLAITDFSVNLRASWRASYKLLFRIKASGSVDLNVSGFSVTATLGLGTINGHPSVSPTSCSSNIGSLGLKFSGGFAAFILNIFRGSLERKFKDLLQNKICDIVKSQINTNANAALAKMKVEVDFGKFLLNYGLVSAPVVTSTYLETLNKGEISWKGDQRASPFSPDVIPVLNEGNSMLQIYLSQYTFNTFAYTAHNNGYLNYNFKINDLPGGSSHFLKTTAQIGALYPNSGIKISVKSTAAPTVKVVNQNLTVSAQGEVEVIAGSEDGAPSAIALSISISMTVQPQIVNEKLIATIVDHRFDVGVLRADIAEIDQQELQFIINTALDILVIPGLNRFGQLGVDLPVTGSLKFYNTKLTLMPGVLVVSTDVNYQ